MATQSDATVLRTVRRNIDLRIRTLEDVIAGQKTPLDRRASIIDRRRSLLSEVRTNASATLRDDGSDQSDETNDGEQSESDSPDIDTDSEVNIEVSSPTEDELRAANLLAEKHEDAEGIAIVEEGRIQVQNGSDTTFSMEVREVLDQRLSQSETSTVPSSIPSMADAAANKRDIQTE